MKVLLALVSAALLCGCLCIPCGGPEKTGGTEPQEPTTTTTQTLPAEETAAIETTTTTPPTTTTAPTTTTTPPADCSKVPPAKTIQCYADEAKRLSDESVCDRLPHYNDVITCKAAYESNAETCSKIISSPDDKDECLRNVAVETGDWELCNQIKGPRTRSECIRDAKKTSGSQETAV